MKELHKSEIISKKRFEEIKDRFKDISQEAKTVISRASDTDVLCLKVRYNSPAVVESAEICNEQSFLKSVFGQKECDAKNVN